MTGVIAADAVLAQLPIPGLPSKSGATKSGSDTGTGDFLATFSQLLSSGAVPNAAVPTRSGNAEAQPGDRPTETAANPAVVDDDPTKVVGIDPEAGANMGASAGKAAEKASPREVVRSAAGSRPHSKLRIGKPPTLGPTGTTPAIPQTAIMSEPQALPAPLFTNPANASTAYTGAATTDEPIGANQAVGVRSHIVGGGRSAGTKRELATYANSLPAGNPTVANTVSASVPKDGAPLLPSGTDFRPASAATDEAPTAKAYPGETEAVRRKAADPRMDHRAADPGPGRTAEAPSSFSVAAASSTAPAPSAAAPSASDGRAGAAPAMAFVEIGAVQMLSHAAAGLASSAQASNSVATPATAPSASAHQVAVQIAQPVAAAAIVATGASDGVAAVHRIVVRLAPPELGSVEVHLVRAADSGPTIQVNVERPATLLLLRHDEPALHRALDQAGVPSEGRQLTLQLGAQGGGTFSGEQGGSGWNGPARGTAEPSYPATAAVSEDEPTFSAAGGAGATSGRSSGLNITA